MTSASAPVTLVLLAAGAGRRFGGLKQLEGVGPTGEAILEYTIHDAIRAGVGRVALVVRPETEAEFRQTVGMRLGWLVDLVYVHQRLDPVIVGRTKPWGTGHAVLCACEAMDGPFVIANADDFYGAGAIAAAVGFLNQPSSDDSHEHALVGYRLRDTLPNPGRVSRAVCASHNGILTDIVELKEVWREGNGFFALGVDGRRRTLTGDEWVSMNLWVFRPGLNSLLHAAFDRFLQLHGSSSDAEFQLPGVVRELIRSHQARVRVLPWTGPWCGVTHRGDLEDVRRHIRHEIEAGVYPPTLGAKAMASVVKEFRIDGEMLSCRALPGGHIHRSHVVELQTDAGVRRFVLQRINTTIFTDPDGLMENVARVTRHLRHKLSESNAIDIDRRVLTFVRTHAGSTIHRAPDGSCWRMTRFIERSTAIEFPRSAIDAEHAGRAFGAFHAMLIDLPPSSLHETIPHFHDTPRRFAWLDQAIAADSHNRMHSAHAEIELALSRRSVAVALIEPLRRGELPMRIAHNDAKLSNVLLDADSGEPLCVVDLDTVMPGTVLFDFGDMMRTMLCPAAEDERDLSKVRMDRERFAGLVRGYLDATRDLLSPVERSLLVTAGMVITYEQGIRFLTDYLQGDQYYQTTRPAQNLDRCRVQFGLLTQFEQHHADLESVVEVHMPN